MIQGNSHPRLLIVEDDPDAAALVQEVIQLHLTGATCDRCASLSQALALDLDAFDLILSDVNLPDGTGLELLDKVGNRRPDLPVILVTAVNDTRTAIEAIRRGASDYIVKAGDYIFAVPLIVQKALALVEVHRENQLLQAKLASSLQQLRVKNHQLEEAVAQLERVAGTDALTGLANRRGFNHALERCFAEARRQGTPLVCLMIDLDGFKQLNDSLGHPTGDRMLQRAARVLEANCRRSDLAARFGGDEFVLLLPSSDEAAAEQVGERIREQFAELAAAELGASGCTTKLTMSIGLASVAGAQAVSADQLLACADHALYSAKAAGKTCLVAYRAAGKTVTGTPTQHSRSKAPN